MLSARDSPLCAQSAHLAPHVLGFDAWSAVAPAERAALLKLLPEVDQREGVDMARMLRSEEFTTAVINWQDRLRLGEFDPVCAQVIRLKRARREQHHERELKGVCARHAATLEALPKEALEFLGFGGVERGKGRVQAACVQADEQGAERADKQGSEQGVERGKGRAQALCEQADDSRARVPS